MAKKYYWLKLQRDFFKRHDIRIIEAMPNGKDYILFYMKLLVESIDHEGRLRFNETIPYNDDMLATITNTNIDVVRSAVKLFGELGLMDILDDGTLFMVETEKMTGSVTDWAEKKRIYREKQKQIGQKEDMSDKSKRQSIEKEIEIEKDIITEAQEKVCDYIEETRKHWNSKENLPPCRLNATSFSEAGRMATLIRDYGVDYVKQAIDKLSEAWGDIEPKYRPKSYQRLILGNVDYWANYEIEEKGKAWTQEEIEEIKF